MKRILKIVGALLVVGLIVYGYVEWSEHGLRASVEQTRRRLRQDGFKTDLSDFNFTGSQEVTNRARTILAAADSVRALRAVHELVPMETVGTNAALAISAVESIETDRATNLWSLVREELAQHKKELDQACAALSTGTIQFQPELRGDIRLPYVAEYKRLAQTLSIRAVLAMHDHDNDAVFTNIWALSRMATAWNPEPADICHLVRFGCVDIAQQAIWESMQTDCWNETRLGALQREWESASLFNGMPATAELSCANMTRICQTARREKYSERIGGWGPLLRGCVNSPSTGFRNFWSAIQGYRQHASYRDQGSYEDEKALLFYFHDRNAELKRATVCSTWNEMQRLPGITNLVAFRGATNSRIASIMNLKQLGLNLRREGRTIMARAAEAETRRRLIVTASALERFAVQHKEYPQSLNQLVPTLLPAVTLDFMDGQELRYRRVDGGRFILYSVGLDGVDNGGQIIALNRLDRTWRSRRAAAFAHAGIDIVWPRPATQADVDSYERIQPVERDDSPLSPK